MWIVWPRENNAIFRTTKDSVRAVAGAHDEQRPRIARLSFTESVETVRPLELGECRHNFYSEWLLIDFGLTLKRQRIENDNNKNKSTRHHDEVSWYPRAI